jgi:glycosyltransferase involved in cell wall biosynthesis
MRICVVIPVYNESQQLEHSVHRLLTATHEWSAAETNARQQGNGLARYDKTEFEFVIANNGSTDTTTQIAQRLSETFTNVQHEYSSEKGRGRALRQAWIKSEAEILAYMDVDLSTDISFFPALIHPLVNGEADLCVGSRLLRPEWTTRGWKREIISRGYNRLLRAMFRSGSRFPGGGKGGFLSFSDAQCGFKAITNEMAYRLLPLVEDNEWFFDTELLLLADYLGSRILDLPVRWKDDADSRVKIIPTVFKDLKGVLRMRRRLAEMSSQGAGERRLEKVSIQN